MSRLSSPKYYSSELSRFCDQHLGFDFNYLDGDEVILRYPAQPITYARETRILRFLESKRPGEEIRRSQRDVLPILARLILLGVEHGVVAPNSGVFILEGEAPYDNGAILKTVLANETRPAGLQVVSTELTRQDVNLLVRCRNVPAQERRAA